MPPRAPQLGCGFPWKAGAAGAQRSHWVQDPVPKSQRNWMQVRHQPPWEAQQVVLAPLESVGVWHLLPCYKQCQGKCQVWNSTWERIANSTQTTCVRGSTALAQLRAGISTHRTCPAWLQLSQLGQIIPRGTLCPGHLAVASAWWAGAL